MSNPFGQFNAGGFKPAGNVSPGGSNTFGFGQGAQAPNQPAAQAGNPFLTPITKVPGGSGEGGSFPSNPSPFRGAAQQQQQQQQQQQPRASSFAFGGAAGAELTATAAGGAGGDAGGKRPILAALFGGGARPGPSAAAPAASFAFGAQPSQPPPQTAAGSNPFGFNAAAAPAAFPSTAPQQASAFGAGAVPASSTATAPAALGGSSNASAGAGLQGAKREKKLKPAIQLGGKAGRQGGPAATSDADAISLVPQRRGAPSAELNAAAAASPFNPAPAQASAPQAGERALSFLTPAARIPVLTASQKRFSDASQVQLGSCGGEAIAQLLQQYESTYEEGGMRGVCETLCPPKETAERSQRTDTIHPMEQATGVFVKAFKRSEAGMVWTPTELRTAAALLRTQNYLFSLMDMTQGSSYALDELAYGFIEDRMRAIRNDISIEGLFTPLSAALQEEHVRFMLAAHYLFCGNVQEIPEGYDRQTNIEQSCKALTTLLKGTYPKLRARGIDCPNEAEFLAYQLLLVQNRAGQRDLIQMQELLVGLPSDVIAAPSVRAALRLLQLLQQGNVAAYFTQLRALVSLATPDNRTPLLLALAGHGLTPQCRFQALQSMRLALVPSSTKPVPVPLEDIRGPFGFETLEEAALFLAHYSIECRGIAVGGAPLDLDSEGASSGMEDAGPGGGGPVALLTRAREERPSTDFPPSKLSLITGKLESANLLQWIRYSNQPSLFNVGTAPPVQEAPAPRAILTQRKYVRAQGPAPPAQPSAALQGAAPGPSRLSNVATAAAAAFPSAAPAQAPATGGNVFGFGAKPAGLGLPAAATSAAPPAVSAAPSAGSFGFGAAPSLTKARDATAAAPVNPFTGAAVDQKGGALAAQAAGPTSSFSFRAEGAAAPRDESAAPSAFKFGGGSGAPAAAAVPSASTTAAPFAFGGAAPKKDLAPAVTIAPPVAAPSAPEASPLAAALEQETRLAQEEAQRARREQQERDAARRRQAEAEAHTARVRFEQEERARREREETERRLKAEAAARAAEEDRRRRREEETRRREAALAAERARREAALRQARGKLRRAFLQIKWARALRLARAALEDHRTQVRIREALLGCSVRGAPRGPTPKRFRPSALPSRDLSPLSPLPPPFSGADRRASKKRRTLFEPFADPLGMSALSLADDPATRYQRDVYASPVRSSVSVSSYDDGPVYPLDLPSIVGPLLHRKSPFLPCLPFKLLLASPEGPEAPASPLHAWLRAKFTVTFDPYAPTPGAWRDIESKGGLLLALFSRPAMEDDLPGNDAVATSPPVAVVAVECSLPSLPQWKAGTSAVVIPIDSTAIAAAADPTAAWDPLLQVLQVQRSPVLFVASTQALAQEFRLWLEGQVQSAALASASVAPCKVLALDGEKLLPSPLAPPAAVPGYAASSLEAGIKWCADRAPGLPSAHRASLASLLQDALPLDLPLSSLAPGTPRSQPSSPEALIARWNAALEDVQRILLTSARQAPATVFPPPELASLPPSAATLLPPVDWATSPYLQRAKDAVQTLRLPAFPASSDAAVAAKRKDKAIVLLAPAHESRHCTSSSLQDAAARLAVFLESALGGTAEGQGDLVASAVRTVREAVASSSDAWLGRAPDSPDLVACLALRASFPSVARALLAQMRPRELLVGVVPAVQEAVGRERRAAVAQETAERRGPTALDLARADAAKTGDATGATLSSVVAVADTTFVTPQKGAKEAAPGVVSTRAAGVGVVQRTSDEETLLLELRQARTEVCGRLTWLQTAVRSLPC